MEVAVGVVRVDFLLGEGGVVPYVAFPRVNMCVHFSDQWFSDRREFVHCCGNVLNDRVPWEGPVECRGEEFPEGVVPMHICFLDDVFVYQIVHPVFYTGDAREHV